MANLRWVAVDFHTGYVYDDIPQLILGKNPLTQVINQFSTTTATLPVVSNPPPHEGWFYYTTPYRSALVALDASDPSDLQRPLWGGIIQTRERQASTIGPRLGLVTAEAYLTRRFIRETVQYPGEDYGVCQVGVDLLNNFVVDGAQVLPGPQLRIEMLDAGVPAGDLTFKDPDDKTVGSAFADQPFEFTVWWEWRTVPGAKPILAPVLTLGTRIGKPAKPGLKPEATFDWPGGALLDVTITDDYTSEKGGNDVMATSTGIGEARPQSDHQLADDFEGRVTVEDRYSAGTSIEKLDALNADALATLAVIQDGATAISLQVGYGLGPAYGKTWNLGDDIGYDIQGPQFPDHPEGVARAIGVSLTEKTYTPILAGDSTS